MIDTFGAFVYYESRLEQKFNEPDSGSVLTNEGAAEVDQRSAARTMSSARATQRTQRSQRPAQREPIAQPDIFSEEFDDIWPSQAASSVRRYRSDVQSVHGRSHMQKGVHADADEPGYGEQPVAHGHHQHVVPARRSAPQSNQHQPGQVAEVAIAMEDDDRSTAALSPASQRSEVRTEDFLVIPEFQRLTKQRKSERERWIAFVVIAAVVMMLGWYIVNAVIGWCLVMQDDMRYGRPRTYQVDQVVGHNDSLASPSHFIAINLNRHVEVIEFPGGDAVHARVYMGPVLVGAGQDLAAVTLTFKDLNHDGRPDMIINVQASHFIFINAPDQFREPRPGEVDLH
jgi:hypothetical protein